MRVSPLNPGVNLFGYFSSPIGLAAAARSTAQLIRDSEIPMACVEFDLGELSGKVTFACPRLTDLSSLPFSTNVYHMNPAELLESLLKWHSRTGFRLEPYLNAIVPFWELPGLPRLWVDALGSMDVVLAPSVFVARTIEDALGEKNKPRVIRYPQSVSVPPGVRPNRRRWLGDRESSFAVLYSFDAASDIERKNPAAAITAFQSAFRTTDDAVLILKAGNRRCASGSQWEAIQRAVQSDPRVLLITELLNRDDLWQLFASVDVYLSLHRAEGLGLGMMEAMALGKPVIATGWSGNMDFMDSSNAIPVQYTLRPATDAVHVAYRGMEHLSWADPDTEQAAAALRALASSDELRVRLGAAAASRIREISRERCEGRLFDELVELAPQLIETRAHGSMCRRGYRAAKRSYPGYKGKPSMGEKLKRAAVRILRRAGLKPPGPEAAPPALIQ